MAEITDDDILDLADRLARELDLDGDARDVITLAVQRLVWPPSPHYFLHDRPHIVLEVGRHDGGGWHGELRCPHGCGRLWSVNIATSSEAVYDALAAAHTEYRTGKVTALAAPTPGKFRLTDLTGRNEYVEVCDHRLTAGEGEN